MQNENKIFNQTEPANSTTTKQNKMSKAWIIGTGSLVVLLIASFITWYDFRGGYQDRNLENNFQEKDMNSINSSSSEPVVNSPVVSEVTDEVKQEVTKAKLEMYDSIMRKNPKEIRPILLKFNGISMPMSEEDQKDFQERKSNMQKVIESLTDDQLVALINEEYIPEYIEEYGSRNDFENSLKNPLTKYKLESKTHISITFQTVESDKNNIHTSSNHVLHAYYTDGKWY